MNLSIPTDSERVRQAFEPKAPPLRTAVGGAGGAAGEPAFRSGVCVTPTLPIEDVGRRSPTGSPEFAAGRAGEPGLPRRRRRLRGRHRGRARELRSEFRWGPDEYRRFAECLRSRIDTYEAEKGFFPPGPVVR